MMNTFLSRPQTAAPYLYLNKPRQTAISGLLASALISLPISPAFASTESDIAELKAMISQMRSDYEQRIDQLEQRLAQHQQAAQQAASQQPAPAPAPAQATSASASANAFNPSIGLVLNGSYRSFSDAAGGDIPGFPAGQEAGRGSAGFSLGESELSMAATIDDRFQGKLTFSLADEDGATAVELEEAFIASPIGDGATLQAGRFLSNIGYLNSRHTHTDAFADRPLPYRAFLNGAYKDDGLALSWVAPTDTYLELGASYLRGGAYPAGGAADQGKGSWTAQLKAGDDIGLSSSWQAGLSYLNTEAVGRLTGAAGAEDSFTGDSRLWILDGIWKWAPNGDPSQRNLSLQGEFFWRDENGQFTPNGAAAIPYDGQQSGWYAQAVYQFRPQWRVGMRLAGLDANNQNSAALAGTALDTQGHDPRDYSLMLDWANSEFSRVRLQYSQDQSRRTNDSQITLQYIMSLGAHGAHSY